MKKTKFLILIISFFLTQLIFAQGSQAIKSNTADSLKSAKEYLRLLKEENKSGSNDNIIAREQNRILMKLKTRTEQGKSVLRDGFDTTLVKLQAESIIKLNEMTSAGLFEEDQKYIMTSNIFVSNIIFKELLTRIDLILDGLTSQRIKFENARFGIDSLISLEVLYQIPKDTISALTYSARLKPQYKDASKVLGQINKILSKIQEYESSINSLKFEIEDKLLKTEQLQSSRINSEAEKEFEGFTQFKGTQKSFSEIIEYSITKATLAFVFYLANHVDLIVLMILFIIGMRFYLKSLKSHLSYLTNENSVAEYYVLKYPLLTSIVVMVNVSQFFFKEPPFLFYAGLWLITFTIFVYLVKLSVDTVWRRWFLVINIFFFIIYFDNLILLPHAADKIFVLALAVLSTLLGVAGLFNLKKSTEKVGFLKWFLRIFILLEIIAILFNLLNYFNASKRLMIAGIMGIVLIILMVWTVKILYKVFVLSLEVYKKSDIHSVPINLERFYGKLPRYLFVLALFGWAFMFVNFFYALQVVTKPISEFFTKERQIGNLIFSYDQLLLFVFIIFISSLIAKIISYLLADSYIAKEKTKSKKGIDLSNWVLIFRIGIISIGLIIAFISVGIPFDRITIILSAISVGIAFGLQTLINNLVSGLIIAFEKPVSVGDVVEVAGKTGRMKSIGFRSSMITTWDGSDVVIPNGDLLNQHLVNWTLGNSKARFEITVGVAYGTNLEEVHQLVMDLLNSQNDILKYPAPFIVFKEFASSSIDMSVKFWVSDYSTGITVKSDLIVAIDKLFKEKNIVIPFPQQDVYVKSLPAKDEK
jgi:small-conductance mechanosensitive channel